MIAVQCWGELALQWCRYQTADKMLTKKTLESKQETAGTILADDWRCQTVIPSRCQKPQYGHRNCIAWTICLSVEVKAVEQKSFFCLFFFPTALYLLLKNIFTLGEDNEADWNHMKKKNGTKITDFCLELVSVLFSLSSTSLGFVSHQTWDKTGVNKHWAQLVWPISAFFFSSEHLNNHL